MYTHYCMFVCIYIYMIYDMHTDLLSVRRRRRRRMAAGACSATGRRSSTAAASSGRRSATR